MPIVAPEHEASTRPTDRVDGGEIRLDRDHAGDHTGEKRIHSAGRQEVGLTHNWRCKNSLQDAASNNAEGDLECLWGKG